MDNKNLDKVVDKYLNTLFFPHEVVSMLFAQKQYEFWVKNNYIVAEEEIYHGMEALWVEERALNTFESIFSFDFQTGKRQIKRFFKENFGKNFDIIGFVSYDLQQIEYNQRFL